MIFNVLWLIYNFAIIVSNIITNKFFIQVSREKLYEINTV